MKIGAVTVWYNPSSQLNKGVDVVKNLLSYAEQVDRIYVVDNSKNDNSSLLPQNEKIKYIANMANVGIAKALNTGIDLLADEGYDWCLTMDQDSYWDKEHLCRFIEFAEEKMSDETVKSFSPNAREPVILSKMARIKRFLLGNHYHPQPESPLPSVEYPIMCICSGNLIEIDTWKKLGKFREDYFIDDVDIEYCFRLKKNGFRIMQNNETKLSHHLGTNKSTFFPRILKHSGIRIYYIFRNTLVTHVLYPEYTGFTEKRLRRYVWDCVFFNPHAVKNIINIVKAYRDYRKMVKNL